MKLMKILSGVIIEATINHKNIWYHGTSKSKFILKPGKPIFISKDEDVAGHYAGRGGLFGDDDSGSITRVMFDVKAAKMMKLTATKYMKYLDPDYIDHWDDDGYNPPEETDPIENFDHVQRVNDALINKARAGGYDGIYIRGEYEEVPLEDLFYDQAIIINTDLVSII